MSYTVNVFVRDVTAERLLALLEAPLLTRVSRAQAEEGAPWLADVFGVHLAIVDDHGMVDDMGITFSQYSLMAQFTLYANRIPPAEGARLCIALAQALAAVVRIHGGACLVVEEMQRVIQPG
jgi:hypothetical protein